MLVFDTLQTEDCDLFLLFMGKKILSQLSDQEPIYWIVLRFRKNDKNK